LKQRSARTVETYADHDASLAKGRHRVDGGRRELLSLESERQRAGTCACAPADDTNSHINRIAADDRAWDIERGNGEISLRRVSEQHDARARWQPSGSIRIVKLSVGEDDERMSGADRSLDRRTQRRRLIGRNG